MCETLPTLSDGSIDDPKAFAAYFAALPEVSCVVMEARWNWGWLYDLRRETKGVEEVENRKDVLS